MNVGGTERDESIVTVPYNFIDILETDPERLCQLLEKLYGIVSSIILDLLGNFY